MKQDIGPLSERETEKIDSTVKELIRLYQLERLPVEGTLFKNTYCSAMKTEAGDPIGTAMIGLYCDEPLSVSCFHRLTYDEVWHFYGGDPFDLILLYPDGSSEDIRMGPNPLKGERVQFVVPAHTWQAGSLVPGGTYALFGCTMAPGFCGKGFEAGIAETLIQQYPERADDILRLSVNGRTTRMPEWFER
jgi:predicted cupin superfamily sugar epimerase